GSFKGVVIRTSWGSGDGVIMEWSGGPWLGLFPPRGVIGFHPKPRITSVTRNNGIISVNWDGPASELFDAFAGTATDVHHYQLERSPPWTPPSFKPVGSLTTARTVTVTDCCGGTAFYRVQLVP